MGPKNEMSLTPLGNVALILAGVFAVLSNLDKLFDAL